VHLTSVHEQAVEFGNMEFKMAVPVRLKKSTFAKPSISLPIQLFPPNIPKIYHLFLFLTFLQHGGDIQDGV
jgi:hypothetical protein